MRLFTAIMLSEEMKDSLCNVQKQLRMKGAFGNFTIRDNMHITLAFIGETEDVDEAMAAVDNIEHDSFNIALNGCGNFGSLFFVGLENSDKLVSLAGQVRRNLTENGLQIDTKPFKPHITMVREINRQPSGLMIPQTEMKVSRVSLMRSDRVKGRLVYTCIHSKDL